VRVAAARRHGARNASQRLWASHLTGGFVRARSVRGMIRTYRAHGVNYKRGGWTGHQRDTHGRFARLPGHKW
jgi:hypothetical protein